MGITRTQVVKFIRKGDKGEKGEQGAVMRGPQAWSDCATGYAFQAGKEGEQWLDVVLYGNNYYVCKKSHAKTASNYPGSTLDVNNKYWQLGDKIDLVATKILLATYALVKNLGVEAIDMRDANDNIVFQAKDGNVTCKKGAFENITVSGASKIGGFTIESGRLCWKAYDYFGSDSRSLKLGVSQTDTEGVVDVAFNAATQGRFGVKTVGSNLGGAAIYASSRSSGQTYPAYYNSYAGYFDGFVHVNGTLICDKIITNGCGTLWTMQSNGYNSYTGINGGYRIDDSDTWFIFRNGICIGVKSARAIDPDML